MFNDVIIIGGGPAGLTAGLYAARARLNSLLIERRMVGGQITEAGHVENYPGFPAGISGLELGELMHQQAVAHGLEIMPDEVTGLQLHNGQKVVVASEASLIARAVIVASGSERTKLGIPGEAEFTGRGVSYCAT
ncbi:MAG: FAD-dependent oxidoreductase, partial [Pseudomonadota bacterium]